MGQLRETHETLIFQHIPKTAGTTLSFILTRHFKEPDIYHVRNLQQMHGPSYSKHFGSIHHFRDLTPDERNSFRLILGHEAFGLHRHLNRPFQYITFIRDPVKRVISQYCQTQRMIKANELDGEPLTLEQFLEQKPVVLNNHQTRFLSDLDFESHTPNECYENAVANINQYFSLVGIVERFDESLLLLSKLLGLPNITYRKENITDHLNSIVNIDPGIIHRIREANQLDTSLYRYAVTLLDEKIQRHGEKFSKELKEFKRKQALLTTKQDISTSLRGLAKRVINASKLSKQ